ncbi:ArdC-like ssDNA-binding domain-containing protein [Pantoea dispersa]|uniref:ArdC-like ssDNA-binding domain-containing protein n=1 Tax=Pantoea dispersa TaxID=59814 RepID=UPI0035299EBB
MYPTPTKHIKPKSQTDQADLYQQVIGKIVASIEREVLSWCKPRRDSKRSAESPILFNAPTRRHYNGVNITLLWLAAEEQDFQSCHKHLPHPDHQINGGLGADRRGQTLEMLNTQHACDLS